MSLIHKKVYQFSKIQMNIPTEKQARGYRKNRKKKKKNDCPENWVGW